MRHYKRQTVSYHEAHLIHYKLLTDAQEEVLLSHISNNFQLVDCPQPLKFCKILLLRSYNTILGRLSFANSVSSTRIILHVSTFEELTNLKKLLIIQHILNTFFRLYENSITSSLLLCQNTAQLINILQLAKKIKKYRIHPLNSYNFDKKGFLLGICHTMKQIVLIYQLYTKKLLSSNQDRSRKFISLLACICADGTALPPSLIYQAKSGDLQDIWLEDFDSSSKEAYFLF